MSELLSRFAAVRERVDAACRSAGREPGEVRLLPVSKTHGIELIRELHDAGEGSFAENKVQEAQGKAAELAALGIDWVLIGHLQTNKAKDVAGFAAEFQALDSLKLAKELDKRLDAADRTLDVMVQLNSSEEEQKFGIDPEQLADFAIELTAFERLNPVGLMTLAINSEDEAEVAECFARVRRAQQSLRDDDRIEAGFDDLSMGMSNDFELAIAHGATTVRVGSAIFGARDYGPQ